MNLLRFFCSIALLTGIISLSTGCKKEQGCTDIDATNFNFTAEEDDGSCTYEGSATLWWTLNTASSQLAAGNSKLEFYVDGLYAGSGSMNTGWDSEPLCGHSIAINVTKDLGSSTSENYSFTVRNDQAHQVYSGAFTIYANQCQNVEVNF